LILIVLAMGAILLIESVYIVTGGDISLPFNDINPISNKIAVIYIEGLLVTDNIPDGLGYASSNNIVKSIRDAQDDKSIKAIVLRINSPGGTPVAAQEIYEQVNKTSSVKPVVVSMGDMATSAAYYISSPSNKIVANPDTFTGSIGVIWIFENRSAFYNKEGVEYYIAKSGPYKDVGSDWRGLTDEEKQYVNRIVTQSYHHFVSAVAEGRSMPLSKVEELADGRIFTGQEAKDIGLVDEVGGMYHAIDIAAKMGNITGTPTIEYYNEPTLYNLLFGSQGGSSANGTELKIGQSNSFEGFYYSPYGRIYMI
jgi:protease-4